MLVVCGFIVEVVAGVIAGAVVKEGLPCEERRQKLATKRRTHPSCKAVANVQRCWGRRESKSTVRGGGMTTAKLGVPFHRHGFMTNWGPGIRDGCRGHLLFSLAWICNEKN